MSQSTGTLTLWQVRAVCAQREPDWTSDHVIVAERGERRQEREERREGLETCVGSRLHKFQETQTVEERKAIKNFVMNV